MTNSPGLAEGPTGQQEGAGSFGSNRPFDEPSKDK